MLKNIFFVRNIKSQKTDQSGHQMDNSSCFLTILYRASLKDLAVKCMFNQIDTVVEESITDYPNEPLILLNLASQIPLVQMQEPPPLVPGDVNAQMGLSQYLVVKNLVPLVPDKQVFIAENNEKKYLVQFQPYTCTCGVCQRHHILAARISCGLKTKSLDMEKKNDIVDDINEDDLVLEGNTATEETTTDTLNCKCNGASKALLIAWDLGQSPNCKGYYHQDCGNVSMAIYFKKRKPKPYWECSACFQITCFCWALL
uniref:Uncharacterized protein n=1 Tax=Romanomermis culicivorax TaxID=13658 RepID=A0A915JVA0_ROMCU